MNNPLIEGLAARVPITGENIDDELQLITKLIAAYREHQKISRADVARQLKTTPQALIHREQRGMRGLDVIVEYAEAVGLEVALSLTIRKAQP
jgi:hypothetical protein